MRPDRNKPAYGVAAEVRKFGGSSFQSAEGFAAVAAFVGAQSARVPQVVVVSAPTGLTESWRELLIEVDPDPSDRIIAGLLPRADTVGAYLLAAALEHIGQSCRVYPADLLGITTDETFCNATPLAVDTTVLSRGLRAGQIAVVPGGQARSRNGDMTWLGKNSSDMSAILLAAALGCRTCEIHSDVPGIYTADPNRIREARLIEEMSFDSAVEMSMSGAKVLHHRAVGVARERAVQLVCRRNAAPFDIGTRIGSGKSANAVIPDDRSRIFRFADMDVTSKALDVLLANNLTAFALEDDRGNAVAVTCGYSRPDRVLAQADLPVDETDERLLSVIETNKVTRRLCPGTDALWLAAAQSHQCLLGASR